MKANLFFANGIMPALASCFIAELQCQENDANVNVLCIEVNSHVKPEYYEVLDIVVAQCKYFQQIVRVNTEFSVMSVKRPISFLKKIAHYREIGNEAKKIIWPQMLENLTAVWAPTTSRLWPFFKKRGVKFNLIEHGIGEYCFASSYKKSTLKSRAMEYIAIVFGYGSTTRFDSIWLCSNAVKLSADSKIVQHNCASQFSEYVNNFWLQYQKAFPVPAQELRKIAYEVEKNASHVYLYLPSDEIRYELYEQFVNKQIMVLGLKNNASF
ncbi:MAG: hypothetical protein K2Q14_01845, partial [Gammaproteobacteria bacterium]|nr:hypothetical protein [Gammaproteobacteria bacterium]